MSSHLLSINSYHYRRGGAEGVYFNHAALMQERGWTNSFFSMHHPENIACADSAYFADEVELGSDASPATRLRHAGRVIYSLEARGKISRLLDSRRIDIAHVHNIYHHQSPSILSELKRRSIPTVMTAHDLKIACPAYKMLNSQGICERCKGGKVWNVLTHRCIKDSVALSALVMVESAFHKAARLYANNLARIIAPSVFYRDKLIEWGWNPGQITHIPNFVGDVAPGPSDPGEYFIYFGRLAPEKGLGTLITSAALAKVRVMIVGSGPEEVALKSHAAALDAPVEFLGHQSGDALWGLVDGARAVVLPSEWYENGPMSVIEAFSRGKPLIGSRIGGIPELIVEGETGWSFTAGDPVDLAARLSDVMAMPSAQIAEMAVAARELVRTRFSAAAYYSAMAALYGELGVAEPA